jgi:phosphocarrier protein HPr
MPNEPSVTSSTVEREFTVLNKLGLHARPAAEFVRCAQRFVSDIEIIAHGRQYSAKRIVDVLLAGLAVDTPFRIVAEGLDADLAVGTLGALLQQFAEAEQLHAPQSDCSGLKWFECGDFEKRRAC